MKKGQKKLKFAIKQLINATWVLRYEIPDDDINRTRKMVGAEPEVMIREHIRDDKMYRSTNVLYHIEEGNDRTAEVLVVELMKSGYNSQEAPLRTVRYPIRNKKHIFDYSYGGPIDQILEKNRKFVEGV
jgi:hypothetical protein